MPTRPAAVGGSRLPHASREALTVLFFFEPLLTLRVGDREVYPPRAASRVAKLFIVRAGSVFAIAACTDLSALCGEHVRRASSAVVDAPGLRALSFGGHEWGASAHLGRHRLRRPRRRRQGPLSRTTRPSADETQQRRQPVNRITVQPLATWCSSTNVPVLVNAEPHGARNLTRDARRATPRIETSQRIGAGRHEMRLAGHGYRIRHSLRKMTPA